MYTQISCGDIKAEKISNLASSFDGDELSDTYRIQIGDAQNLTLSVCLLVSSHIALCNGSLNGKPLKTEASSIWTTLLPSSEKTKNSAIGNCLKQIKDKKLSLTILKAVQLLNKQEKKNKQLNRALSKKKSKER